MLKSILLASAFIGAALAQTTGTASVTVSVSSSATQSMPVVATQAFNAGLVNTTVRQQWCRAQRNVCTDICTRTSQNDCTEESLTYACVCLNGTRPDVSVYALSLPAYICEETYIQCMNTHPSTDPEGQQQCISNRQYCGSRNSTAIRAGATTTMSSSSSVSGSATGSASGSGAAATSSRAAATTITPIANGAFVALLLALCKFAL